MPELLRVTYTVQCGVGEDPRAKAADIAFEQTVELPGDCVSRPVTEAVVGRVESVAPVSHGAWRAVIAYPVAALDGSMSQLMTLLFGNISLKAGIAVREVEIPGALLARFPGPALGVDGMRDLCGVTERRPLLCTAIKPLGLGSKRLARICREFALGGVDLIKDDHGLANQLSAPFAERVARCAEAVAEANAETGGRSVYLPNVLTGGPEFERQIHLVQESGCRGVLVSPMISGFDAVAAIARTSGLAILAHPALAGSYFHAAHGIAPAVLLGQVFRLIGSDGVIFPNVGGRFNFSEETCRAIAGALGAKLGGVRPAFPVLAGGIHTDRVPYWLERYGPDTVYLVGGSLYRQGDLVQATKCLREVLATR